MASYSDEGLEQLARTVREELDIDDIMKVDSIEFLRLLKHKGCIKDYVRLPDSDLPDAEAKYDPDDDKIYLRKSVSSHAEKGVPHDRFTVFHEGAHALLGHQHERKRSLGALARTEKRVFRFAKMKAMPTS